MGESSDGSELSPITGEANIILQAVTVQATAESYREPPAKCRVFSLVGRVSYEWSRLEQSLDYIVYYLADMDAHMGACVTAQMMGVWPRLLSIKALLTFHLPAVPAFGPTIKLVNRFEGKCRDPSERRNRAVHDPWWIGTVGGTTVIAQSRNMPKGNLVYGTENIDPKSLLKLIKTIRKLRVEALTLYAAIRAQREASPQTKP